MEFVDPRWKDLYRFGGMTGIIMAIWIVLAVIGFFIWPYKPGFESTQNVFVLLKNDRLGGLIALDGPNLLANLLMPILYLALYGALKRVNESYALIALVLGLMGAILIIPARPIAELVILSDSYASAVTDTARHQFLLAGDVLLTHFNGVAWMINILLTSFSGVITSLLMLRCKIFSKTTAYLGLFTGVFSLGFMIPIIGTLLLFLTTITSIFWLCLVGRRLFELAINS